ncbi:MAG: hypothetical protein U0401_04990 [Anaerolineae bacterium]
MLFQHTWRFVVSGQKTQTRRLAQEGDQAVYEDNNPNRPISQVIRTADAGVPKLLYQVGKTYSVQPGIAKKTVGQIRLTAIRRERLQDLSEADALQEMPGASAQPPDAGAGQQARQAFQELWATMYKTPGSRWEDNPEVWVLEFEPAQPGPSTETSPFGKQSAKEKPTFSSGKGLLAQLAKKEPDGQ